MTGRWSLKEQNRGASLVAVLVALIFVAAIGMIIAHITITNIQLKEAERAGKDNFYSAEIIMDDLTSGLNNKAAVALQNAYNKALADYRDTMVDGIDIQDAFMRMYLTELETVFWDGTGSRDIKYDGVEGSSPMRYIIGKYDGALLEGCFSGVSAEEIEAKVACLETAAAPEYHVDFVNGVFTLKDIRVRYKDSLGYETYITTDIVFHTPEINFTGSNIIKDFMRYSIIADTQIRVASPNVTVNGNAYAGYAGILGATNGSATFTGNTIVTRGDVTTQNGATLNIGSGTTKLWAENIRTEGSGSASVLNLNGNLYISDDLTMEGDNSEVKLTGNYYGYNFQDKYDAVRKTADAAYSSAMMINGKNSKLNMESLNYLLLSGRTYISRGSYLGSGNQDVMLGESLSVRTNQLAYFVPNSFLDMSGAHVSFYEGGGIEEFASYLNMNGTNIASYLDSAEPVVAYYFPDPDNPVCYYLNFASEQSANDFFAAYAEANRGDLQNYTAPYVAETGLIVSDSMIYTLKGDMLYRKPPLPDGTQDKTLYEERVTISGGDWQEGGIYWSYANRLAITYKSLQMYLEESHSSVTADDVRFIDPATNRVDKTITPLMDNLIDVNLLETNLHSEPDFTKEIVADDLGGGVYRVIVLSDNASTGDRYVVPDTYQSGIIIATGDVHINNKFSGMIIAGGTVTFSTGASVSADEMMVSQMFSKDMAGLYGGGSPVFSFYFREYNTFSESVIGMIEIERFTSYDGWTKTEE